MELKGQRALVTGSTKGIGRAIAEALVGEGVETIISARTEEDIERAVEELSGRGPRVVGKACDVGEAEQVEELMDFAAVELDGLDILVNNAGAGIFKEVETMTPEEWRCLIATNLDALFYCCHFALPLLKKSGSGFIINLGSLAGKNAFPRGAAYNASKFGLVGFSEALMQEVRYQDVRVAYIMPGSVDTWFAGSEPEQSSWKLSPGDIAEITVQTLKRDPRCLSSRIEVRPSRPPQK